MDAGALVGLFPVSRSIRQLCPKDYSEGTSKVKFKVEKSITAIFVGAATVGALTLGAGTAHADTGDYLRNLETLGVQGASVMGDIFLYLGKFACAADAAGYSKSQQEQLVADRARDYLEPGEGMTYDKIGKNVRLSAKLFLCP